ncbi:homeobox protein 10-like isoform X2 [Mangifera indica]|uniref:homeobox protein 10-like isoform X2 n=1 Tax=Mangifera indica TaxID=29780 RepID=UPI001CFAC643|nr:homeobox protein 10-like isoform X2 [Mangifera indica]
MENSPLRSSNNGTSGGITSNGRDRSGGDGGLLRASPEMNTRQTISTDFVLQWGNRKRLRCMKVQVKDDSAAPAHRTTVRVVRTDKDTSNQPTAATANSNGSNLHGNGYYSNLRQRPCSPPPPPPQRILRNSENSSAMRGQSNGVGVRGFASPDRGAHDKRGTRNNNHQNSNHHNNNHNHDYNKSGGSSETAHDSKKGGSSSASGEAAPPVWPPKFVIALTNKEKEEDFMAIKGSKLPQRPKKRAKFIQRTLNRPRGLKAMGNMDSDSE